MMRMLCAVLVTCLLASSAQAAVTGWSTANYLTRAAAVWPGQLPLIMSIWVNTVSAGTLRNIMSLGQSGTDEQMRRMYINTTNNAVAQSRTTTGFTATSTGTVPSSAWAHVAGSFVSSTLRSIYLQNVRLNNTSSITVGTPNAFFIGINPSLTAPFAAAGGLGEASIWNVAGLSETERDALVSELATLVGGTSARNPLAINADSGQPWTGMLIAYWRLTDQTDLSDLAGNGHTLSMTGTLSAFASHPPVDTVPTGGAVRRVVIIE